MNRFWHSTQRLAIGAAAIAGLVTFLYVGLFAVLGGIVAIIVVATDHPVWATAGALLIFIGIVVQTYRWLRRHKPADYLPALPLLLEKPQRWHLAVITFCCTVMVMAIICHVLGADRFPWSLLAAGAATGAVLHRTGHRSRKPRQRRATRRRPRLWNSSD